MNSAHWDTLTNFVKWFGREGKCMVDETEKGWYVYYIDRDPEIISLQEALVRKEKMESGKGRGEKRKLSALDEIIEDEEKKKEYINRKEYWLVEGIVVKVIAKCLGDRYCRKNGFVIGVPDKYVATVSMLVSGHKLKLDQEHLETVLHV
ncbi:KIN17-like protein, partial [Cryptotermes secundus]|uniref:KIN17-like protein n=1 Tax=Cryptotermes secundus TaxID=105785 RepID=UPI000CD7AED1